MAVGSNALVRVSPAHRRELFAARSTLTLGRFTRDTKSCPDNNIQ